MQPAHHRKMVASSKVIKVGPWGGSGGSPWDDGAHRGVRSITVTYGRFVESVRVEYDRNGRPVLGEKHGGGTGNSRTEKIKLDFPYEFLTGVGGCYRPVVQGGPLVIRSLTFRTNRGRSTSSGKRARDAVRVPDGGGVVVGFSGRSGWHLDAVGLHVAALRPETLCDVVQERGAMAYRSIVYGAGPGAQQPNAQNKKAFEWCYK